MKTYSREEVYESTISYFGGDDLATNVFIDKYCLRDREGNYLELNPSDMHKRLAKEFARTEEKYGGPNKLSFEEIFSWLENFKYIVPQGSIMYGLGNDFSYNSLSNCTVIDKPRDSISSIMDVGRDMANLFKMRCGVGVDISSLRPDGAYVNNSAITSTGAWSFVKFYSEVVNTIGQKGRRGAGLVSMDVSHPDIIKFLSSKRDISTSTGVNISIKIFDSFMYAVLDGSKYNLHWEDGENKYQNEVDARELWNLIVKEAAERAEPGLLFWDRHIKYNPSSVYEELRPETTNPCLTGDTKVYVADGRGLVSIKDLADIGEDIPVFCLNDRDKVDVRYMRHPRITGYNESIFKLVLDDGSVFRTTGNHKFKLRSGGYKQVSDLVPGDSLCIVNSFEDTIKETIPIYPAVMDNKLYIDKYCECCGETFSVPYNKREICFCSYGCGIESNRSIENFGLKEAAENYNHKVVSVEFCGYEDVYNGTVEDFHNFFVACNPTTTSNGKEKVCMLVSKQCGEIPLSSHDMCRLISCNISNLVEHRFTKKAKIDFDKLSKMYTIAARLGDDLVELELEKIQKIMGKAEKEKDTEMFILWEKFYNKTKAGRRIGTGCHGLADLLSSLCLRYDSKEALEVVDKVFETIRNAVYNSSIELSKERGSFELFDWEKEKDNEFIMSLPKGIREGIRKFGRRNVCLLTCAPTGSVSICSRTSSGIEPMYKAEYERRKKVDRKIDGGNKNLFTAEDGQVFETFKVYHPLVSEWRKENPGVEKLPEYFVEAHDIDYLKRVDVQATIQLYVDNSISSTLNAPKGTTWEEVGNLYMRAWEKGLKGITVYVEGSREGILLAPEKNSVFEYHKAPQRPEVLECDIHHMMVKSEQWIALVGLMGDDRHPYEIFAGRSAYISLPKKYDKGQIVKRSYKTKPSEYDLYLNRNTEDEIIIRNIGEVFKNDNESVLGRLASLSLRSGSRPSFLSEQLLKDPSDDFHSYSRALGRVLKKYITNGETPENGSKCPNCSGKVVYQEGCMMCLSCGWGKCS